MVLSRKKLRALIESFLDGNLPGEGKSYRDQPKKYRITKENPRIDYNKSYYDDIGKWDMSSIPHVDNRTIEEKIEEFKLALLESYTPEDEPGGEAFYGYGAWEDQVDIGIEYMQRFLKEYRLMAGGDEQMMQHIFPIVSKITEDYIDDGAFYKDPDMGEMAGVLPYIMFKMYIFKEFMKR